MEFNSIHRDSICLLFVSYLFVIRLLYDCIDGIHWYWSFLDDWITLEHCRTLKPISGWVVEYLRVVVGIEHLTVLITSSGYMIIIEWKCKQCIDILIRHPFSSNIAFMQFQFKFSHLSCIGLTYFFLLFFITQIKHDFRCKFT